MSVARSTKICKPRSSDSEVCGYRQRGRPNIKGNHLKKIEVLIPAIGVDLIAYFQNLVDGEFSGALNVDAVAQSDLAVLDNIQIGDVTVDGQVVTVKYEYEYEYEYSADLGCKDMDWSAADDNSVNGHQVGNVWVFDRHKPWEPRSTLDEF